MIRILLCEDDAAVAAVIGRILELAGYEVIKVDSASNALNAMQKPSPPDLLITDLMLLRPMSGMELTDRVLEIKPSLPVIILTGYATHMPEFKNERLRGVVVLHKPLARQDLLTTVHRLVTEPNPKDAKKVP